jgi:hypothetical protein
MSDPSDEVLVYCLTRDRELADAVEARLSRALAFFYNDAARLHQAVVLRQPDLVLVDTRAIRQEYGDAGLGPVVAFVRERAPAARRRPSDAEWLIKPRRVVWRWSRQSAPRAWCGAARGALRRPEPPARSGAEERCH